MKKKWYVVCWRECDHCWKKPNNGNAVRFPDDVVPYPGKYLDMKCPNCSKVWEFKRGGWWANSIYLDDELEDSDGTDKLVRDVPDYTERMI